MQVKRRNLIKAGLMTALTATLAVAGLTATSVANAGYNVWTNNYTLPLADLQARIEPHFPANLQYAQVFQVQLSHPRLTLNVADNRVVTVVDMKVVSNLLLAAPITGTLTLSSRLKYDPPSRSIRLDAPRVERVDVGGIGAQYAQQLNAIGAVVAEQVLNNYPIYTFKPEDLRLGGKTFEPGAITMQTDGIVVEVKET
ncbi:DUF1439 domain-containing protein [Glaciimonas sp. PCH181]|uniref:DUF1439 domain-containing protein n=1 Tax=Glaciimonas sp. PCH181 TaxID=2133943 RepID=UPI000D34CE2F|nr:DUF1439 domain-containing protein [Glaciimonas sp. PCH181]PUA16524.1 DUF1439 domain-containing protein [Glaciimonas sp. PCH181]